MKRSLVSPILDFVVSHSWRRSPILDFVLALFLSVFGLFISSSLFTPHLFFLHFLFHSEQSLCPAREVTYPSYIALHSRLSCGTTLSPCTLLLKLSHYILPLMITPDSSRYRYLCYRFHPLPTPPSLFLSSYSPTTPFLTSFSLLPILYMSISSRALTKIGIVPYRTRTCPCKISNIWMVHEKKISPYI